MPFSSFRFPRFRLGPDHCSTGDARVSGDSDGERRTPNFQHRTLKELPSGVLLFFSVLISPLSGGDRFEHRSLAPTGGEEAVLVLCPGMNADGGFFLEEEPWVSFAREHRLGLTAIDYRSGAKGLYSADRRGYYWPEQGSGEALLEEVRSVYGADLPILIYGFSGGAHFASRFVEWVPERIIAWSAYSAQFWDSPGGTADLPPGIVACGEEDGVRWFPSFAYFYEGRELGKPWAWVSLADTGHTRNGPFEAFVRDFFGAVLDGGEDTEPVALDILSEETVGTDDVFFQPGLVAVLPSPALVESWRALHAP